MSSRSKALLARARKLRRQDGPIFLTIVGDPEVGRSQHIGLLPALSDGEQPRGDDREGLLRGGARRDHGGLPWAAEEVTQECGAFFIKLGHPENIKPLKEAPPYPPRGALPTPDGRRQRYDA